MTDHPDYSTFDEFEDELPVRALLETLSDPFARYTVYYLYEETTASLDTLADAIIGWVNSNTGQIATRSDRDRARLLLYHVHLPMLDSLDAVQFDAENRTVIMKNVSPTMESFIEWLRHLDQTDGGDGLR